MSDQTIEHITTPNYDTITSLSDQTLKSNIVTLNNVTVANIVEQLRPVSYMWTIENADAQKKYHLGFIAQEVKTVLEEHRLVEEIIDGDTLVVYGGRNNKYSIQSTELIPLLVSYVQSLKVEINTLRADITTLQSKLP